MVSASRTDIPATCVGLGVATEAVRSSESISSRDPPIPTAKTTASTPQRALPSWRNHRGSIVIRSPKRGRGAKTVADEGCEASRTHRGSLPVRQGSGGIGVEVVGMDGFGTWNCGHGSNNEGVQALGQICPQLARQSSFASHDRGRW